MVRSFCAARIYNYCALVRLTHPDTTALTFVFAVFTSPSVCHDLGYRTWASHRVEKHCQQFIQSFVQFCRIFRVAMVVSHVHTTMTLCRNVRTASLLSGKRSPTSFDSGNGLSSLCAHVFRSHDICVRHIYSFCWVTSYLQFDVKSILFTVAIKFRLTVYHGCPHRTVLSSRLRFPFLVDRVCSALCRFDTISRRMYFVAWVRHS